MKLFNRYTLVILLATVFFACEDEDLKDRNFPVWETGVNGFGQFQGTSALNFIRGDMGVELDFDFQWISIDGENTVSKIEFFVDFNEKYINKDGDPAAVDHDTQLAMTVDSPPAGRTDLSFTLTQAELYTLFQSATFDYNENGTAISVFANPDKTNRDVVAQPFIEGDSFTLSWALTTADGRVFDSWSPSACTELPGSNCQLGWIVECGQVIAEPAQDYTITMVDSYGDGWNGAAINVVVDGTATPYTVSSAQGGGNVEVVTVPAGTTSLSFEFVSGDWDSEVTFNIKTEKGNVIAAGGPSPGAGTLTLDLCTENN